MRSAFLHFANILSVLLPQTRAFGVRRFLYRLSGVQIANDARLNGGVVIQFPNVTVGSGTWVGRRTEIVSTSSARVSIGDRCDVSQDVLFITGSHEIGSVERRAGEGRSDPIEIGDGVWIGARATIMGGVSVGGGAVIAAGSLVRVDVPENVLVAGVPARIIRTLT